MKNACIPSNLLAVRHRLGMQASQQSIRLIFYDIDDLANIHRVRRFKCITRFELHIRDIRAAHAQDNDTASTQSPVDELKADLEFASNFKGGKAELQLIIICKRLGINYKSLTTLETQILIGVLGKSPLAKNPINRRKRHK